MFVHESIIRQNCMTGSTNEPDPRAHEEGSKAQPLTTIVTFDMPAASADQFLIEWSKNNAVMREQPGQRGGTFYRSVSQGDRVLFIKIAHWDSADAMSAARVTADRLRQLAGQDFTSTFRHLSIKVEAQTLAVEFQY